MKNTNTTNTTATVDTRKAFSALLETYANESTDTTTATYAAALTDLATAVAYSVLKKCINTGYNETLVTVRSELTSARRTLESIDYCNEHAAALTYNDNGDLTEKTLDNDLKKALTKLASVTIGDGLDLVNTAIVAILDETKKQVARGESVDLERPYTVRRLKKKVWIKSADSVNGWETVETTPIREIYKAVRRYITQTSAMSTDPRNGYSYIQDMSYDSETGESETIYRRLTKYANLGGYACDYNGAMTFYTVDNETVDRYDSMVESLNLTKKQATVLSLKMGGYGNKAIATYLGCTENSIKGAFTEIRRKAKRVGLDPTVKSEK